MRKALLAGIAAGTLAAAVASVPAEARGGCGAGFRRGPYGGCRPNRGPGYAAPPALVVGTYYRGRGYWYGGRYWRERYRYGGGWRYR